MLRTDHFKPVLLLFIFAAATGNGDEVPRQAAATAAQQELSAEQKLAAARSHVEEGVSLVRNTRAGVSEYYLDKGTWPNSVASVPGPGPLSGPHLASIAVVNGTIVIKFSASAAAGVAGKQLVLRPTILQSKTVYWTCGYAQPQGADPATGAAARIASNIDPIYLPARCR